MLRNELPNSSKRNNRDSIDSDLLYKRMQNLHKEAPQHQLSNAAGLFTLRRTIYSVDALPLNTLCLVATTKGLIESYRSGNLVVLITQLLQLCIEQVLLSSQDLKI